MDAINRPPELDLALLCEEAGVDPAALTRLAEGKGGSVSFGSLSSLLPGIGQHVILAIIAVCCRANALEHPSERVVPSESKKWDIRPEAFRSLVSRASIIANTVPHLRKLLTPRDSYRVAATIPQRLIALDSFYGVFENIALGMRRCIEEAQSELYLVAPFFTREGIDVLSTSLESAFKRGVRVTVLARCLSEGEQNRRALEGLITSCEKIPGSLSLFESEAQDGAPLLHAKILVRDSGEEVYVGSANLTGAGMERTLEVGVFLRGDGSREIAKLLKELIKLSERRWP